MKESKLKSWARVVAIYWLLMAALFTLEFMYMESDWAGLPGFILTLPLSAVVVAVGLFPAIAGRLGYEIPLHMSSYHFEYGFVACAFLNAFLLYPFYKSWSRNNEWKAPPPPPPPNNGMHPTRN